MVVSEIKLYKLLNKKIGESESEAFIQILENKVETRPIEKTSVFATRRVATAIAIVSLTVAFIKLG